MHFRYIIARMAMIEKELARKNALKWWALDRIVFYAYNWCRRNLRQTWILLSKIIINEPFLCDFYCQKLVKSNVSGTCSFIRKWNNRKNVVLIKLFPGTNLLINDLFNIISFSFKIIFDYFLIPQNFVITRNYKQKFKPDIEP